MSLAKQGSENSTRLTREGAVANRQPMGAERRESERANVHHAHVRWTVAALARRQSMPSNRRQRKGGAHLKSGSPIARLEPHILNTAERSKGAAGFRCRQLDGRAAILMVVARPGGCELAGSVCGSSARPFTCLEATARVVLTGHPEHVAGGCANFVAPAARPRSHPVGNRDYRVSRHATHYAANRWSLGAGCVPEARCY